jgi:THO complex subunit 7
MSKAIKEFPDRQTTETRLAEIEAELEKSRQEEEALDEKLLQRKKQFHLLIHTIHQV